MRTLILMAVMLVMGCTAIPPGVTPVKNFNVQKYLGRWYEIARLDHSFERGLTQVSADYALRPDGGLHVVNRGWSDSEQVWQEAIGKAFFVHSPNVAHLKVSFFGPFYGAYVIFALDSQYQWALVSGPSRHYLWILSRTPHLSLSTRQTLVDIAKQAGFDTESLIWVKQPLSQGDQKATTNMGVSNE